MTVRNAGELTVTATQSGDDRYFAAEPVLQTFNIGFGNLFADSIPGLSLWLDAIDINNDGKEDQQSDFLVGGKISLWADKSGNNNSPVEANSSRMPNWVDYDSNLSLLDKPVVQFSAQPDQTLSLQSPILSHPLFFFWPDKILLEKAKFLVVT